MKILSFDPSGNFSEGKGTTGICTLKGDDILELNQIEAKKHETAEAYWHSHVSYILMAQPEAIVMEGYRLYNHRGMSASTQANSILETPMLIGVIRYTAFMYNIPLKIQYATDVKRRWSDEILFKLGYLQMKGGRYYFNGKLTNAHQRDALRHALHFKRYGGLDK